MDIVKIGAEILIQKLGLSVNTDMVTGALSSLLGKGDGKIDFASLVSSMQGSGQIGGLVSSWLGDGSNLPLSAESILSYFGQDKVSEFASKLGVDSFQAASGLSEAIPSMIDKASSGGNLLKSLGDAGDLLGKMKSLF